MVDKKVFRCPFEVKGEQDGTIIEVVLTEDKAERLAVMCAAITQMYEDRTRTAIRFILPTSILKRCYSNEVLRLVIMPYQVEFLAADMHCRLAPFLPYQKHWFKKMLMMLRREHVDERLASRVLTQEIHSWGYPLRCLDDLVEAIQSFFWISTLKGVGFPLLTLGEKVVAGDSFWLFQMDVSAFATFKDQDKLTDPAVNNALFTIVKSPFYPKTFGRYSENVEIVVTRDVDVAMLPGELKQRIRREANEVHYAAGIRISDLDTTQQPTGLWVETDS